MFPTFKFEYKKDNENIFFHYLRYLKQIKNKKYDNSYKQKNREKLQTK